MGVSFLVHGIVPKDEICGVIVGHGTYRSHDNLIICSRIHWSATLSEVLEITIMDSTYLEATNTPVNLLANMCIQTSRCLESIIAIIKCLQVQISP
jgi:hypothetical protein